MPTCAAPVAGRCCNLVLGRSQITGVSVQRLHRPCNAPVVTSLMLGSSVVGLNLAEHLEKWPSGGRRVLLASGVNAKPAKLAEEKPRRGGKDRQERTKTIAGRMSTHTTGALEGNQPLTI